MSLQMIELFPEDDIVSICDRLDWAKQSRVLLVLPNDGQLLTRQVDLARLRRKANQLRIEVGLVTRDPKIIALCAALGFPTFRSPDLAFDNERRWRRGRRRIDKAGLTPAEIRQRRLDHRDRAEVTRRRQQRPNWQQWVLRYMGIFLFIMTLALFYIGLVYAIPGATVQLRPYTSDVQISRQIVADPQLGAVTIGGASIPARILVITDQWQTEVATTGSINVADTPARGEVVLVNTLDQPITVPAGTRVTTSAGQRIEFQTVQPVDVPGVSGGSVQVNVVAIEPGPAGNVDANQINQVEGTLGFQLEVRNLAATSGGGVRAVAAVSQADLDRLRAQVIQYLLTQAKGQMESQLGDGEFLAQESLQIAQIYQETVSHFVGEQTDTVALELRAEIHATAVDSDLATELVYEGLIGAIDSGYALVPDSFNFYSGRVLGVDGEGRVSFEMIGEGKTAAEIEVAPYLDDIAGQDVNQASDYLFQELPLAELPQVDVAPNWFGRLPYLSARINTEIVTE